MGDGHAAPFAFQPVGFIWLVAEAGLKFPVQHLAVIIADRRTLILVQQTFGNQFIGVDVTGCWVAADFLIHHRLGEHRLVTLVMAKAAVANNIDDHIDAKLLAELGGDPRYMHHRFGIISIDMENRRHDHFCNIG